MALVTKLERPEDIDIPEAYSRLTGFHVRRPTTETSGAITFTIIEYDTYMSAKARNDNPEKPIRKGERIKVKNWRPTGSTKDKVLESVYGKLATELDVENVKV